MQRIFNRRFPKRKYLVLGIIFLLFPNPSFLLADDYSSSSFIIRDPVITIGGGRSTSTSFEVYSSIGQTSTGINTSTSFISRAGFLYFPAVTEDEDDDSPVVGGGGGGGGGRYSPISPEQKQRIISVCDFNKDGACGIADFSILLYYFDKTSTQALSYDLNHDGVINLIDFSILLYYWSL